MRKARFIQALFGVFLLIGGTFAMISWTSAAQNQQGPGVGDQLNGWAILCGWHGGDPVVEHDVVSGFGVIACIGGHLGGLTCIVSSDPLWCDWSPRSNSETVPEVPTDHAVDVSDLAPLTQLPVTSDNVLAQDAPAEPMLVQAVITRNQSGESNREQGLADVNACRSLGGIAIVNSDEVAAETTSFTVQCEGGMFDGLWCEFEASFAMCFFEPGTGPEAAVTEPASDMPTGAPQQTSTSAATQSPTEVPTEMPTEVATVEPTAAPTEAPVVEPTDEPVIEPTFDTTTDDPWTAPIDGPLVPLEPEPTPTEAPLR